MNNRLNEQRFIQPEMIATSLHFWFNDNEHVRSPFPLYIKNELEDISIMKFLDWTDKLDKAAKDEINDEILLEKFEEILFESALGFVKTDDEKITVQYPFMIRVGDKVNNKADKEYPGESVVISRSIAKEGDHAYLKVVLECYMNKKHWETSFELP